MEKLSTLHDEIVKSETKCLICKNEIKYVAIVKGKRNLETVARVFEDRVITDDVVAYETFPANNGKAHAANIEIIVKCPECGAKSKTRSHYTLWKADE
ncbi:hypothetical protein [Peribacillus kribbensis]|uniref:hypothetical protein n=1 Tax=Peribacillus kribbensis TaxID=356658 RepID=UPI000427E484|nr:hypothetical protein [Peribacillus kribbensis]